MMPATEHLLVAPVLLPLGTAALMLMLGEGRRRTKAAINTASTALGLALAIWLLMRVQAGGPTVFGVYLPGNWPVPFGIVLVADPLAAFMAVLAGAVGLAALLYALARWQHAGVYFHVLFQLQLMGLYGAFLTGDLFNLFVFFEVLLIASYVLLVHGQGRERFRMGVHYVVLNLVASGLFLIGLSLVYAATGTLNMADVAQRVAQLQGDQRVFAQAAALVLLVVFGLKAAMLPLYFWLPGTYAAASAPVAALFAIMTKVGVYSIIRVHWGIFGPEAGEAALAAQGWLLPMALTTSAQPVSRIRATVLARTV